MTFTADYAAAIVFPCHETNCYNPAGHGGVENAPRAFVIHTPEEPADDYPGTPHWFAIYHVDPKQRGSTHYFVALGAMCTSACRSLGGRSPTDSIPATRSNLRIRSGRSRFHSTGKR